MAHITLSVPDNLYRKMKEHSEIKWSAIAREAIASYLDELKDKSSSGEIRKRLSPETSKILSSISEKEAKRMYKEMAAEEWKRVKSTTRTY